MYEVVADCFYDICELYCRSFDCALFCLVIRQTWLALYIRQCCSLYLVIAHLGGKFGPYAGVMEILVKYW